MSNKKRQAGEVVGGRVKRWKLKAPPATTYPKGIQRLIRINGSSDEEHI